MKCIDNNPLILNQVISQSQSKVLIAGTKYRTFSNRLLLISTLSWKQSSTSSNYNKRYFSHFRCIFNTENGKGIQSTRAFLRLRIQRNISFGWRPVGFLFLVLNIVLCRPNGTYQAVVTQSRLQWKHDIDCTFRWWWCQSRNRRRRNLLLKSPKRADNNLW